jgi:hypothetical protein
MRTRWTKAAALEIHALPRSEQLVVAALCAHLDAEPVDPTTLEPLVERDRPRCVLCGSADFKMQGTESGWLCTFEPACRYRTRVAAGVPKWQALRDLEAEKAAA